MNLIEAKTTHHHLIYNHKTQELINHKSVVLESNTKNFPVKCFYNEDNNEVYSFYR